MTDGRTGGRADGWMYASSIAVLCFLTACGKVLPPSDRVIALEGATLIDGTGGDPKQDAVIIIRNGHIEAVARVNQIPIPGGAERVNLVGKTIIPGLIDSHAHVERWAAGRYLAWGVTTVRDLHGQTDSVVALKNAMNLGSILGPRMFVAGAMIDGNASTYPNATGVTTLDRARRAVDLLAVAGVDYVKVYTKITPAPVRSISSPAAAAPTIPLT